MPGAAGAGGDGRGASVSAPSGPGMHGMCLCHHQLIQRLSQNRMPAFCDVQFVQVTLNFPLYSTQSFLFCFLQNQTAPFNWRGILPFVLCSIFPKYISSFSGCSIASEILVSPMSCHVEKSSHNFRGQWPGPWASPPRRSRPQTWLCWPGPSCCQGSGVRSNRCQIRGIFVRGMEEILRDFPCFKESSSKV